MTYRPRPEHRRNIQGVLMPLTPQSIVSVAPVLRTTEDPSAHSIRRMSAPRLGNTLAKSGSGLEMKKRSFSAKSTRKLYRHSCTASSRARTSCCEAVQSFLGREFPMPRHRGCLLLSGAALPDVVRKPLGIPRRVCCGLPVESDHASASCRAAGFHSSCWVGTSIPASSPRNRAKTISPIFLARSGGTAFPT